MPDSHDDIYNAAKLGEDQLRACFFRDFDTLAHIRELQYGKSGLSPIARLAKEGDLEAANLLLRWCTPLQQESFLYGLALGGHKQAIQKATQTLESSDRSSSSAKKAIIRGAAEGGHTEWLMSLLDENSGDKNAIELEALMEEAVSRAALAGHQELVNQLLLKCQNDNPNPEALGKLRKLAAMNAFAGGHSGLFQALCKAGADSRVASYSAMRRITVFETSTKLPSRTGFANHFQSVIINLAEELKIPINQSGICQGFAVMATLAGLANDLKDDGNFTKRLRVLSVLHKNKQLFLDKVIAKKLPAKSATIFPTGKQEIILEVPDLFHPDQTISIPLSDIENFLFLVSQFQSPDHGTFSFWKVDGQKDMRQHVPDLAPVSLDDYKIAMPLPFQSDSCTREEIAAYLERITHLNASPPISLVVRGLVPGTPTGHAISITYNPQNAVAPWTIADANTGVILMENDINTLTNFVFSSLGADIKSSSIILGAQIFNAHPKKLDAQPEDSANEAVKNLDWIISFYGIPAGSLKTQLEQLRAQLGALADPIPQEIANALINIQRPILALANPGATEQEQDSASKTVYSTLVHMKSIMFQNDRNEHKAVNALNRMIYVYNIPDSPLKTQLDQLKAQLRDLYKPTDPIPQEITNALITMQPLLLVLTNSQATEKQKNDARRSFYEKISNSRKKNRWFIGAGVLATVLPVLFLASIVVAPLLSGIAFSVAILTASAIAMVLVSASLFLPLAGVVYGAKLWLNRQERNAWSAIEDFAKKEVGLPLESGQIGKIALGAVIVSLLVLGGALSFGVIPILAGAISATASSLITSAIALGLLGTASVSAGALLSKAAINIISFVNEKTDNFFVRHKETLFAGKIAGALLGVAAFAGIVAACMITGGLAVPVFASLAIANAASVLGATGGLVAVLAGMAALSGVAGAAIGATLAVPVRTLGQKVVTFFKSLSNTNSAEIQPFLQPVPPNVPVPVAPAETKAPPQSSPPSVNRPAAPANFDPAQALQPSSTSTGITKSF